MSFLRTKDALDKSIRKSESFKDKKSAQTEHHVIRKVVIILMQII